MSHRARVGPLPHVSGVFRRSTHEEQDKWYKSADAAFDWLTAGPSMSAAESLQYDASTMAVSGYSYSVDSSPSAPADKRVISTTPSASVTAPGDGVWYFHVRAVAQPVLWNDWWRYYQPSSWAPTATYAFRVDGTPPSATVIRPEEGATYVQGSDVNCDWTASDDTSGVASELATVDGSPISKGDRLDTLADGEHVFGLTVDDAAGGPTEVTRHFTVAPAVLSAISVSAPTGSASQAQGSSLPVAWTTDASVSGGQFSLWLVSSGGWYGGKIVAADGTASYADSIALDVPVAAGYQVYVYYRAADGAPWSIYAASPGTVAVTAP
jgi:hypothetical protein